MKKFFASIVSAISLGMTSLFTTAYAAVPAGVDTSIEGAQTDAVTVGGYLIAATAGLIAIIWMLRLLRRG